jgi:alkylated DNA nucleotide flippase Atl1
MENQSSSRNGQPSRPEVVPLAEAARTAGELLHVLADSCQEEAIRMVLRRGQVRLRLIIETCDRPKRSPPTGGGQAPAESVLSDIEAAVLEVLAGGKVLTGPQIAALAGYPYDTHLRSSLAALRRRGLIGNKAPGYYLVTHEQPDAK